MSGVKRDGSLSPQGVATLTSSWLPASGQTLE